MEILYIIVIIMFAFVVYSSKRYYIDGPKYKESPMKNITELRHHHWLLRTGMKEHADNFNGFGLTRTIRRKKGRRGLI